ncbi:SusC/RagA family TonB-linked outer membrane protein [Pedobacter ginsengisoli]|uniref:SusC/RagA family TonB-linked outer membrane protein n=1 Tax=Pedobacter ginsengisoli TaxID=363852 RepID=UPI00254C6445|nr:SusC/RagA family TonB-linked outer membrane protein [Pedobacter ginsengisoli]
MIALAQVSARGFGQKITLNEINAPIEKILQSIKSQSDYGFIYNVKDLNNHKVTLKLKDATIEEAVKSLTKDLQLSYKIVNKDIVLTREEPSLLDKLFNVISNLVRDLTVRGVVKDQDGKPLPNASIRVKGKSAVINTNQNGEFEIRNVAEDAVLLVGYVGYKTLEIPVRGAVIPLEIKLEMQTGELEEVNVTYNTGYQTLPKERATGSFTIIDNKTLNQQIGLNILKRLDGVTNGVLFNTNRGNSNPQNQTKISIRGLSTINGPLDPLIVLDNFIYEGDINNINPNDIENITVLKDAAAASIWGARAGNGVIVITTKKGRFSQKTRIDFNTNVLITERPDLFSVPQMQVKDYIEMEEFLFNKGYFNNQINGNNYRSLIPSVEIFLKRRNGLISKLDSANQIDVLKQIDTRKEYNKSFTRNEIAQQYSLAIRGGSEKNAYTASVNYDKNRNYLNADYEKINLSVNNTYKPTKKLEVNLSLYYTNSEGKSGAPDFQILQTIASRNVSYLKFEDEGGSSLPVTNLYRNAYLDTAGAGKLLNWRYYPLDDYKHNYQTAKINEMIGNIGLTYTIFKPFSVSVKYQYQRQDTKGEGLADEESFYTRNNINLFSQLNRTTGIVKYNVPMGGILALSNSVLSAHNIRGQANLNQNWKNHAIYGIIGAEIREMENTGNSSTIYGYKGLPLIYTNVDYINTYRTFVDGSFQSVPGGPSLSSGTNRFVSLFSNFSYVLLDKYTVSASARKDGSNILGVNTNDKWKPLWSAGLSWDITKEKFYKLNWLPTFKIRTTLGSSGNVDLSRSALPISFNISPSANSAFPSTRITTLNNPELRWEQSKQFNFGFDFALKNAIISGGVEFYIKKGTDLYGPTPFDYTAWGGGKEITKNVANMKGHGIDAIIKSVNMNRSLRWETTFLLNYNNSKTTAYFISSAQTGTSLFGAGRAISPVIGKPLYAIAAYKWAGLDIEGNPQGFLNGEKSKNYMALAAEISKNGIASESAVFIGSTVPVTFGSIGNSFSWKGVFMDFNIVYKFGYYFKRPALQYSALAEMGAGHIDYESRWLKPGDETRTNIPSFQYPIDSRRDAFYAASEINVLKADHIRLQFVNVGYTFSRPTKRELFSQLQAYVNISNIGILWRSNKDNLDPDYPGLTVPSKGFAIGLKGNF